MHTNEVPQHMHEKSTVASQIKMIRLGTSSTEKAPLEEKKRLCEIEPLKCLDDEHSLTSATAALSDSEFSGDQNTHEEQMQPVVTCDCGEDLKAPALADLSYSSVEKEDERPEIQKYLSTINDDDDILSQASASTLLSDLSSVEEKDDSDRLEKDLELRDKLIGELLVDKDPEHIRIVREHEETMRKALRELYEQKEGEAHRCKARSESLKLTYLQRISETLLLNESARGAASIILYCVAHLSCWEITTAVLYECTQHYENQCSVHVFFLFTSLVMLRMSGGIFGWLDSETYGVAQSAVHRAPDARLMKWFRRHPNLKSIVNMLAFYVCWTAVAYFQNGALKLLDKRDIVAQGLPSYHHSVITSVKDKLVFGLEYEEDVLELEALDYAYLEKEVSISSLALLMGDEYAAVVSTKATILFFASAAVVSIAALRFKLGHMFEI